MIYHLCPFSYQSKHFHLSSHAQKEVATKIGVGLPFAKQTSLHMFQFSANSVDDNILAFYFTRIEYCVCFIVISVFNTVPAPYLNSKNNNSKL